mgnify:CR=1 FL=1
MPMNAIIESAHYEYKRKCSRIGWDPRSMESTIKRDWSQSIVSNYDTQTLKFAQRERCILD